MLNDYKEVRYERHNVNRKYKKLKHGSHKNGTVGVEYPGDGHNSVVYSTENMKI